MKDIKRMYKDKDALVNLVYNHMKVAGPKSLTIRTDIPLVNQHQLWNIQEFAAVRDYYAQLYTELQSYIESAYGRGINPVTDYLYKSFLDSLASSDLQKSVHQLHAFYKRTMTEQNAIVIDTAVERNTASTPTDYSVAVKLFVRMVRLSSTEPLLVVPLAQYRFNLEIKHQSK